MRGTPKGRRVIRRESTLVPFFFLAAVFCATFEKVQWNVAGSVFLADVTALGFLFSFAFDRFGRRGGPVPRTAVVLIGFLTAFLLVYLIGFFNLETGQALDQYGKGIVKWLIHFAFLIVGVVYLSRKSLRFYWRTLGWFLGGIAFNGAYGILQLLSAQAGHNLDSVVLKPLTRGASQINVYGAVNGSSVYRPNALTGDPNHLGIMLVLPLLILTPLYLRLPPPPPPRAAAAPGGRHTGGAGSVPYKKRSDGPDAGTGLWGGVPIRAWRPRGIHPARVFAGLSSGNCILRAGSFRIREGYCEAPGLVERAQEPGCSRNKQRWPSR